MNGLVKNSSITSKSIYYLKLMRCDKPIGSYLLLWPTLAALFIAAGGLPSMAHLIVFSVGVFIMRSAGCVINDIWDRNIDASVARTQDRPLAQGVISLKSACCLFVSLVLLAFLLVLTLNPLTIKLAFLGVILVVIYPLMKRYMPTPQVVLGLAFNWGIIMSFSAERSTVPLEAWCLYGIALLWTIVYDTQYAMVDRKDDLALNLYSTAIFFGQYDRLILGVLQCMVVVLLWCLGEYLDLGIEYCIAVVLSSLCFVYQQWLMRFRLESDCFKAFTNHNIAWFIVFLGVVLSQLC